MISLTHECLGEIDELLSGSLMLLTTSNSRLYTRFEGELLKYIPTSYLSTLLILAVLS